MSKKVALVTGASGGIGSAICERLDRDGYTVIGTYRNPAKYQEWLKKNEGKSVSKIQMVKCDVSDFGAVTEMIQSIISDFGAVDVLVNNAGITKDGGFRKMTKENWDAVMTTNLDSVFNCCKCVIDKMVERNYGRIISISSINGQKGQFGQVNYSAAKAGMYGFTKALALEVAKKGVTVNTISPGYIATEMVMAVDVEIRNKIIADIPVGRLGTPEEVANTVSFLASDEAGFLTGSNIAMNGGQHMY